MLKIVFILPHGFRFIGWSVDEFLKIKYHFSKEYLRVIKELGNEALLYSMHEKLKIPIKYKDIKLFPVDFQFPPFLNFGNEFSLKIIKDIILEKPDIIHVHNYYVWYYPFLLSQITNRKIPIVAQFHGDIDPLSNLKLSMLRNIYKETSLFLVSFKYEVNKLHKLIGIQYNKIKLFTNVGVDSDFFKPQKKSVNPKILYVGRFPNKMGGKLQKKPLMVVKLFEIIRRKIPELELIMVGEGNGIRKIKEYITRKKLYKKVKFLGYIPRIDLPKIYSQAWLTIVPIHLPEMTILWDGSLKESLACKTPVVVFGDRFDWSNYGLLMLPYNNMEKFTNEIIKVLYNQEEYFDLDYARKLIENQCSWKFIGKSLINFYKDLS
jgi:glycosyltransferase involved in cell wall biosynthesis